MEVITYSLKDGQNRSDRYYHDIATFTDEVLAEAEGLISMLVEPFQVYLQETGREAPRTHAEYVLELLTLGVLWQVYAANEPILAGLPRQALTGLAHLRDRASSLKPVIDGLRGVLATLFLVPNGRPAQPPKPTLGHLDRLLGWLAAAGDFGQEVKRLRAWRDFLAGLPDQAAADALAAAIAFAAWFEARSGATLGRYTPHVERFLSETHPSYRWREDRIFCGRRRVEYHMNMVGTEILNRAFRGAFRDTARQVVLLPPCMKARPDDACQAHATPLGARCAACTPGCRIHQLTQLGKKHGFEAFIMPHELSVFASGKVEPVKGDSVGVVGVSCVLTNPSGGWETRDLDIPAQGVLLDYCGCRYHWHKQGIPTDINLRQLLCVLGQ